MIIGDSMTDCHLHKMSTDYFSCACFCIDMKKFSTISFCAMKFCLLFNM